MYEDPDDRSPARTVLRPIDQRVVAGVCAGIGRTFNITPILVRLVFVILTPIGGVGLLAYLVLALGLPVDRGDGTPVPGTGGWVPFAKLAAVVVVAIVVVAIIGLVL